MMALAEASSERGAGVSGDSGRAEGAMEGSGGDGGERDATRGGNSSVEVLGRGPEAAHLSRE